MCVCVGNKNTINAKSSKSFLWHSKLQTDYSYLPYIYVYMYISIYNISYDIM